MSAALTPAQSVWIHGIWRPKRYLAWADILKDPRLNLKSLVGAGIPLSSLHYIQSDPLQWISTERMCLDDCLVAAPLWETHPIHHFHADLGDMVSARWPPDQLVKMGVTYTDLVSIGLTPENMKLFTYITLSGWSALGFTKEHATRFTDPEMVRLFGMTTQEVLRALR